MNTLPGYPFPPGQLPDNVLTEEGFRDYRLQVLRWQLANNCGIADAMIRKNFEFLLQHYESGNAPPPHGVTWWVYDGRFVTTVNGERATTRTIGLLESTQGYTLEPVSIPPRLEKKIRTRMDMDAC